MESADFERHIGEMANGYITILSVGLGRRVGIIQHMLDDSTPVTSQQLAERTNLKERYVREWLGCMVAARIVVIQPGGGDAKYVIPRSHHAGVKAWGAISLVFLHYPERVECVADCFKVGGPNGFGYEKFPYVDIWNNFRNETSDDWVDQQINHYREVGLTDKLEHGVRVLDIGTGTGNHVISFGRRYPNSTFVGVDTSEDRLSIAKNNASETGLANVTFQIADVCDLPAEFSERFDIVLAVEVIHNLPDPHRAMAEAVRALKPDGVLSMLETYAYSKHADNEGDLDAAARYGISLFECLPCSMSGPPHVGYGGGWGMEGVEKAVMKLPMKIVWKQKLERFPTMHYVCSK